MATQTLVPMRKVIPLRRRLFHKDAPDSLLFQLSKTREEKVEIFMESKMKPRVPSSAVSVAKKMTAVSWCFFFRFEKKNVTTAPPPFAPTLLLRLRCGHVFQSFNHVRSRYNDSLVNQQSVICSRAANCPSKRC